MTLTVRIAGDYSVVCRPSEISQVLMNLLGNSFDAVESQELKWVTLTVDQNEGKVNLAVTDSGKGVDTAIVQKIMDPFFTTKGIGRGTGIGLSISKGIAENHNGTLSLDTKSKVTRFVLEIPAWLPAKKVA